MFITKKVLKATGLSKLCLVIYLDDGVKLQYPVLNEADAIAKYQDFLQQNQAVEAMESSDFSAIYDTFSGASHRNMDWCAT